MKTKRRKSSQIAEKLVVSVAPALSGILIRVWRIPGDSNLLPWIFNLNNEDLRKCYWKYGTLTWFDDAIASTHDTTRRFSYSEIT